MKNTEKLYESFGELLYVMAMADGEIQSSELQVVKAKLASHPWGKDIAWSFNYEVKKQRDVELLYDRVIAYCEEHGPDAEYAFLLETLEEVATANQGVEASEQAVMDGFKRDLIQRFKADLEKIQL
ncbi:MAG: TerB family tellurite resistance protein [Saprospiraceae bacterium]